MQGDCESLMEKKELFLTAMVVAVVRFLETLDLASHVIDSNANCTLTDSRRSRRGVNASTTRRLARATMLSEIDAYIAFDETVSSQQLTAYSDAIQQAVARNETILVLSNVSQSVFTIGKAFTKKVPVDTQTAMPTSAPVQQQECRPKGVNIERACHPRFEYLDNGLCAAGITCSTGKQVGLFAICDGHNDCDSGEDEETAICQELQDFLPPRTPDEERVIKRDVDKYSEIVADTEGSIGSYPLPAISAGGALSLVTAVVAVVHGCTASSNYDARASYRGTDPWWITFSLYSFVAKTWSIIWEFKSSFVFIYTFDATIRDILAELATQPLPESCVNPPIQPRYNFTECDLADTCSNVPRLNGQSECTSVLKEIGSHRLFKFLSTAYLDTIGNGTVYARRIQKVYGSMPRDDMTMAELECSCTRMSGPDGVPSFEQEFAEYYTYALALVQFLSACSVVVLSGVVSRKFGTVDYFIAILNAKTSKVYLGFLGCSALMMAVALVHLVLRVEEERQAGNLATDQYTSMYETLFVGYVHVQ